MVGSHLIGGAAGYLAHSLLASGVSLSPTAEPLSTAGLALALSGVVSVALTSWGMIATETVHAPACATTLIVSLGLLSTPFQVGIIVASVVVLVGFHAGVVRVFEGIKGESHSTYDGG